jgi:hypothetical protein
MVVLLLLLVDAVLLLFLLPLRPSAEEKCRASEDNLEFDVVVVALVVAKIPVLVFSAANLFMKKKIETAIAAAGWRFYLSSMPGNEGRGVRGGVVTCFPYEKEAGAVLDALRRGLL